MESDGKGLKSECEGDVSCVSCVCSLSEYHNSLEYGVGPPVILSGRTETIARLILNSRMEPRVPGPLCVWKEGCCSLRRAYIGSVCVCGRVCVSLSHSLSLSLSLSIYICSIHMKTYVIILLLGACPIHIHVSIGNVFWQTSLLGRLGGRWDSF